MCNSEALNVTCSVKTSSKEAFSNSPSSGLALRNLGKSDDSDDEEEDDLARLLDEQGEQDDDEFELIENPCNGFNRSNVDNRCNGLPNVALNKQGQFALCSSEAVAKNETRYNHATKINTANKTLAPKVSVNLQPLMPSINVSKPNTQFNFTVPKDVIKRDHENVFLKPSTRDLSPEKKGSIMNVEEMEGLLAGFENDDSDADTAKIVLAKFDTTDEVNAELKPMGYGSLNNQVYPDVEVLDYYESSDDEFSMDDEDGLDDGDIPMPPPILNGGVLRRHNAAIFMPIKVSCLYG